MAGEIEEPFQFNFQADLLHSGSISFGRFDSESLSWERRSSFSHNRYLEEVEKYSKPGSVTEKKAYFEAHFKRKALLKQSSSEIQNSTEFEKSYNKDSQESENGNESPHSFSHLKYDEEPEIQKFVKENIETLCPENNVDCIVSSSQHVKLEKTHEIATEKVVLVKKEEITKNTLNDMASDASNSSKVCLSSEMKQQKQKLKAHATVTQVQRIVSNGSVKSKIKENKGLLIKEKEKKSPRPATSIVNSGRKTSKSQESSMSVRKVKLPENKRVVKENRSEKTVETKSLPVPRQTANRTKETISTPSKPLVNKSATCFTFKSDERAERRKEEKRAAELAQSRKSRNFKATPMPSFYKESTRSSDQHKVINRPRTPCISTNKFSSNSTLSSYTRPNSSSSLTNRRKSYLPENKKNSISNKQKESERPQAQMVIGKI